MFLTNITMDYSLPKYLSIANAIISQIQNKQLKPGEKVPSENEIITKYGVSNTTARKVLQEIEIAGYAEKIQGKGTFVKNFMIGRNAAKVLSFTKNMIEQGLTPSTKLIDSEVLSDDFPISVSGKTYFIEAPVFKIQRLRLADGIPMMYEIRYISLKNCPMAKDSDLEASLYEIYKEKCKLTITRIEQDLTAIKLDENNKALFGITKDIPGILVEGVTFCAPGKVLEGEHSIYRADKYKFSIEALPEKS